MKKIMTKKILKRTIIAGIILLLPLAMLWHPEWFPGILYPIKDFDINLLNSADEPPMRDREPGREYPEGFVIIFHHTALSQFAFRSYNFFYGKRPREKLFIKEVAWEWEGGSGVFTQDFLHEFSEGVWARPENGWHCVSWMVGFTPYEINFIKMFKKKKLGDIFPFRLVIRYRFDNEPETVQVLEYQVTAQRGAYRPTYLTFLL
jgi:hypothetical protein